MAKQKRNVDPKGFAAEMAEKIKTAVRDGSPLEIPRMMLDYLAAQGIELPEKAKQAILEFQSKK